SSSRAPAVLLPADSRSHRDGGRKRSCLGRGRRSDGSGRPGRRNSPPPYSFVEAVEAFRDWDVLLDHGDRVDAVVDGEEPARPVVAALPHAAEWERATRARGRPVPVDQPGANAALEALPEISAVTHKPGDQAIGSAVRLLDRCVEVRNTHELQQRTEDLV